MPNQEISRVKSVQGSYSEIRPSFSPLAWDVDVFPVVASLHPGGENRRPEIRLRPQAILPQVPKRKLKKESSLLGC